MKRKNPAAVALGRKGGKARADLPTEELSRIGKMGGRPRTDAPRCLCGAMTVKCAEARRHKCK